MLKLVRMKVKLPFLKAFFRPLHADVRIGEAHVFQKRLVVLADPGFFVMARYVVPVHSVIVELIKDRQAILRSATLDGLAIVRLRFANAEQNTYIIQYLYDESKRMHYLCLCYIVSCIRFGKL